MGQTGDQQIRRGSEPDNFDGILRRICQRIALIDVTIDERLIFVCIVFNIFISVTWIGGADVRTTQQNACAWIKIQETHCSVPDSNPDLSFSCSLPFLVFPTFNFPDNMKKVVEISGSGLNPANTKQESTLWKAVAAYLNCGPPVPNNELAEAGAVVPVESWVFCIHYVTNPPPPSLPQYPRAPHATPAQAKPMSTKIIPSHKLFDTFPLTTLHFQRIPWQLPNSKRVRSPL